MHKLTHSDHFFKLRPVSIFLWTFDCNLAKFIATGDIGAKFGITNLPSLQILGKIQNRFFSDFQISGQSFINKNSGTNHDIDMKPGIVTKRDKRNTTTSNKIKMMLCRHIVTSLSFLQFMVNLQPSGSQILDAWTKKIIFSSTIFFYFKKAANKSKSPPTQFSYYCFE